MSISVPPPGSFGSKLSLNAAEQPKLDAKFEEITEGEELTKKEKLKTKWAALEALVGDPKRIALVATDLVAHFEKRVEATRRMSNDEFGMTNGRNFAIRTSAFALRQGQRQGRRRRN